MKIKLIRWLFPKRKDLAKNLMRAFVFLFCTTLFGLMPNDMSSQNEKIIIDRDTLVTVDGVFKIIKKQTDYIFTYHSDLFKDLPKIKLKRGKVQLGRLLKDNISNEDFNIIFTSDNTILIKKKTRNPKVQQRQVSGKVTAENGLPLAGVTVQIKGTFKGVVTDFDGEYSIMVPDDSNVLVFSFLGYKTVEIAVADQIDINVTLEESISQLDEVVVNAGYYRTTQKKATGSIAKITSDVIGKQPVNNPLGAIVGRASGVNIRQVSATPGSGFSIEIRGKNFINSGTSPLYIVDGVPYSDQVFGRDVAVGIINNGVSPLNSINPANIESIEILKDADATAIYGSRGANGVVLITTKKGKEGKTQLKIDVSSTLGKVTGFVDLLDTEQYLEMRLEALANDGYTLDTAPESFKSFAHDLYRWSPNRYTDWQEVLIGGTAQRISTQLIMSGGNNQTQFLMSGGYQNETTVFPGDSNYGRASIQSSVNHRSKDERFNINFSTTYTLDDNELPAIDFADLAYRLPPNAPALYDENGDLNWENSTWRNPLALLENRFFAQTKTLILNSVISYHLTPGLDFRANMGYTNYDVEQQNIISSLSLNPNVPGRSSLTDSSLFASSGSRESWIVEPQINWQKKMGKANLDVLLGTTFQKQESNERDMFGFGFPSNSQIMDISAANTVRIRLDEELEYKYQAIFGRINLKWADRYVVNLTGRRDGSSRFGPGRQFGNFGAIGLAWLFSEEDFLKDNPILSFGKLRSSYGSTGSDGIADYAYFDTYDTSNENYNGSGLEPSNLFNPVFGWETNKKFEAALELGLINDRIFLTTAWYRNRSSNQLIGIPLPGTTGFSVINGNFDAIVENTGFEVDFRSVNVQSDYFQWSTNFNLSVPNNKLVRFDGLGTSTFRNRYVVGEPLSIIKRFHLTGVDPETGIYQFEDYNNDGEITVNQDTEWVERTAPKFYGGINNTLNYKNWTLDVFFNFTNQRSRDIPVISTPGQNATNQHIAFFDRWQQAGDEAPTQRYTTNNFDVIVANSNYSLSNAAYANTSFIRLKNVLLTYNLPEKAVPGLKARIYMQGQNLLIFTKSKNTADAEQLAGGAGLTPMLRQLTLGIEISF